MRGSVVPRILPQIIGFAIYASAIVVIVKALDLDLSAFSIGPLGLLGETPPPMLAPERFYCS
jgi:putative membrane protein